MAEPIKFTKEELESLQGIQNAYQTKTIEFGQLKVQKILLSQQMDSLEKQLEQMEVDYTNIQENERKLVADLNQKYGPGSLNPDTGVFTPAPPVEESPEV